MEIPFELQQKIVQVFREKGRRWLNELPEILEHCRQKWELSSLQLVSEFSYNLIFFAESALYGKVALKIGVPNPEVLTEIEALRRFSSGPICTCWDSDPERGTLLLERIEPGDNLTSVEETAERVRVAADIMKRLSIPAEGKTGLPPFSDWIDRAFSRNRLENADKSEWLMLVGEAESMFRALVGGHRPLVILHGDLHHFNILLDSDGGWRAIDPKGITGVFCLEAARFMQNQLGMFPEQEKLAGLDAMTAQFGTLLGESKRVMAECLFIDSILSTCWNMEDDEDPAQVEKSIQDMKWLHSYVTSI